MDIFTDASLNDHKKIAGVSAIFVPTPKRPEIISYNTYCFMDNIETAELFAISIALNMVRRSKPDSVRIISDSVGALKKIQRIFHHPNQTQIQTIDDLMQKRILYNMSASFTNMRNTSFTFYHVHGHQRKASEFTDGYYNMIADQEADSGRIKGETVRLREERCKASFGGLLSAEEETLLAQQECMIVSPHKISFYYEDSEPKPKLVRSAAKRTKGVCPRRDKQNYSRNR